MSLQTPKHIDNPAVLYMDGVSVSFDGFKALNSLSMVIAPGEMRAIIGPNGAGKTTMMDVITGKTRPDTGTIIFTDNANSQHDLTRFDEADVANLGVGRKFQKPSVIESLTVFENLEMSLKGGRSIWQALLHKLTAEKAQKLDDILDMIDLADKREELAGNLSHGQKQWLEIGMLLGQEPQLLLIDEPAAGMTDEETMKTAELFKRLAQKHSLMVVEHDMDFIEALDCKVTVLHEGHVLAEGSLATVKANPQVIEVYLGR
ncbi:urea ABC transporter ATP-binding protein UrtD [Thalassolituus hydrocarboniclasticus]|uniref:Urea ABC transporter ATP-binding protein UrtD n=1 Tax=Thalassolituus hydrocarboniclasticus TaxID=2742796 RepID=A0ABY6A4N9_9GAMM|nr:urea ABC transporter ATP-binding protein UrtD [Thalassolituus hydrocarboniclasticus]UXD86062.1 urea ABC transporter ATP-binding protein UrtD [Thalassolituus hydrocarboniclasticus]